MIIEDVQGVQAARILVVGNEQDLLTCWQGALQYAGHDVATAPDPAAAFDLLTAERFDMLLMDVVPPYLDALELVEHAQTLQPPLDAVFITADPMPELLEWALQHGVADCLPRPIDGDHLRLPIARVLERQHLRRENARLERQSRVIATIKVFATSLDRVAVAAALGAAIREETGLHCVHVELDNGPLLPESGLHEPCACIRVPDPLLQISRLPIEAHGRVLGQLILAAPPTQADRMLPTDILRLLVEHGALALHNAVTYAELNELDEQKSEFIAIASHELRTPLSVVVGYSGMLTGKLNERQNSYVTELSRAAIRINDLVDDLINLRRIERDEFKLDREPCSIHSLLATLCRELQPLAAAHAVALTLRAARQLAYVMANREWLLLALAHLITNGIRFTPRGGSVTVSVGQQRPEAGGKLLFVVDDTGIGISALDVQRIFKRFYQVADSRTRQMGGLGIGLALARGIIELHGGSLAVKSKPGRGSRFVVAFPPELIVD